MYRTILVPIDGSATATRGLHEALRLAKLLGSRVVILHVVEDYSHHDVLESAAFSPGLFTLLREAGKRILDRAARLAKLQGVAAKAVMVERPGWMIADLVVEQAKKLGASLIVIGTHGRRGVKRLVLGSDAEQIVRLTLVPVLLVRSKAGARAARRRGR